MEKRVFKHMRTVKAQIRLHIRAVWSWPSLSANRIISAGPRSLVDKRVDSYSIRFLTAVVRARSGHMWESQVLLRDGQVVFLRVLRFSPTFDEQSARYKWNILERAVKPK